MNEPALIRLVYRRLLTAYGEQRWWPGDSPFEVMVGAVLTQNTAWRNVEKAIGRLHAAKVMTPAAIYEADPVLLAQWLRPAGYYNLKAQRLRALCLWLHDVGGVEAAGRDDTASLRRQLLGIKGIGPETADAILLYAFQRPVFVIDAYTRRLFGRLGIITADESYCGLAQRFQAALPPQTMRYNEYHALVVRHGKEACRSRPRCQACCLAVMCQGKQT